MNRIMKLSVSSIAAASAAIGTFALGGTGAASAATKRPPAQAVHAAHPWACSTSSKNYPFPARPATFKAGSAGTVTVAAVNSGTIKVAGVQTAKGWRVSIDSRSGSSVDLYFRNGTHKMKFEAEINDAGGLTIRVTSC